MSWQPWETAPKDGRIFLGFEPSASRLFWPGHICFCRWDPDGLTRYDHGIPIREGAFTYQGWKTYDDTEFDCTQWCLLPDFPVDNGVNETKSLTE